MALLRQYFRPEFLNRVDETIVFQALGGTRSTAITELLRRLARVGQGPVPKWDQPVLDSGQSGCRSGTGPVRRAIQSAVETPLARRIIAGEIGDGRTVILQAGPTGLEITGGSR